VSAETVRTFLDVDDEGDAPEPDRQLEPRRGAKF
jgi:hypothetical protein